MTIRLLAALSLLALPSALAVQGEAAESYHLWNRVPREAMRELSTDRPGIGENPFTVDAGHFLLELELGSLVLDRGRAYRRTELAVAAFALRAGVLPSLELQLQLEPYRRSELEERDARGRSERTTVDEGFGATSVRVKINVWGDDGGSSALALLPFMRIEGGGVDFGLAVPFAGELVWDFSYGITVQGDIVVIDEDDSRGLALLASAALGRAIVGPLAGYVELGTMYAPYDAGESTLAIDAGVTVAVLADLQLDASVRFGLAGAADDVTLAAGVAGRL